MTNFTPAGTAQMSEITPPRVFYVEPSAVDGCDGQLLSVALAFERKPQIRSFGVPLRSIKQGGLYQPTGCDHHCERCCVQAAEI